MEFLFDYALFLAKTVTMLLGLVVIVLLIASVSHRQRPTDKGHIEITNLNDKFSQLTFSLKQMLLSPEAVKQMAKAEKQEKKSQGKAEKKAIKEAQKEGADVEPDRHRVFVIDFNGDVRATEVSQLREEVTAVLSVANETDEILLRLESPGGVVHGYGLAASQLSRIVGKGLKLTIAVDKVAASGGYMMACIGTRILAAPFAVLGSIGVVAELPNFHRLLKKYDVDMEVMTAGEYKRTLTMFGENTEQGREKFQEELEDVHELFKSFVAENRPSVDVESVSTGEAWYGQRALDRHLVDELKTSDEYLVECCDAADVFQIRYVEHKSNVDRLMDRFNGLMNRFFEGRHGL
ncbi:MAG: protease SohB [Pseudomonadales bacterium]|nr:protease SohB [Pseudomonadales bacterium]